MRTINNQSISSLKMELFSRADPLFVCKLCCANIKSKHADREKINELLPKLDRDTILSLKTNLTDFETNKSKALEIKFLNLRDAFLTLNELLEDDDEKKLIQPIIQYLSLYKRIFSMITTQQNSTKPNPDLKYALTELKFEINLFVIKYGKLITDIETNLGEPATLERNNEEETEDATN